MSAIWGIVDLSVVQSEAQRKNRAGNLWEEALRMRQAYRTSCLDRIQEKREATYYLACGVQDVTREAVEERFPYERKGERRSLFVADVILDNRGELVQRFGGIRDLCSHPDGEILYESFCSHPEETLAVARGAYACAYLEPGKRTLTLFNDAVGNRSVYYFQEEKRVYFSTLLAGITCERENWKENTGWFDRFYTIRDLRAVSEPRETPYAGILRLAPGEIVVFTEEGVHRRDYWDPFAGRRILRGKTEAGYRELVTTVFRHCVEDVIREGRGGKETGILLSGGLDSNAVAAYAAPYLAARGKKLYSFTAVPEEKERARIPGQYAVEDERGSVELVRRFHGNLEPEYLVTNRGDLLAENRRLREVLEVPCKAVLNLPWMYESYRLAAQKDCGILLSGQYGNITISYGDFRSLFLTLLHQGRIKELVREINVYSRKYRRSRKWIWRDLLTAEAGGDHEAVSRYMYDKSALRQIGEYEVKLSLATGVVPRDPTRDKRLIALVLSLPAEQFTHAGQERRLVRQYLQGKIPEEILADEFHKGRQGVGSGELLALQWERICEELSGIPGETMSGENRHSKADMVRGFYVAWHRNIGEGLRYDGIFLQNLRTAGAVADPLFGGSTGDGGRGRGKNWIWKDAGFPAGSGTEGLRDLDKRLCIGLVPHPGRNTGLCGRGQQDHRGAFGGTATACDHFPVAQCRDGTGLSAEGGTLFSRKCIVYRGTGHFTLWGERGREVYGGHGIVAKKAWISGG